MFISGEVLNKFLFSQPSHNLTAVVLIVVFGSHILSFKKLRFKIIRNRLKSIIIQIHFDRVFAQ